MLIDTHCHMNIIVKNSFDTPLLPANYTDAQDIINQAQNENISKILNVGTSLVESKNCIELAVKFAPLYAAIGIHPNDLTSDWQKELKELSGFLSRKQELKIVAIGECGIDKHYPDYNLAIQKDAFKAQIELALAHNLPVIVHTRDAGYETLRSLEEFKQNNLKGVIHCFSEDLDFAKEAISMGFLLGIGGTITYPKNNVLRSVLTQVGINNIILETDAPFLPPQIIRGKQNQPKYIKAIAEYIAELLNISLSQVAQITTDNAQNLFNF